MTDYAAYPEHPLHGVPHEVLSAARRVTVDAARWRDLDPDVAEPLADAVVAASLPAIREWLKRG